MDNKSESSPIWKKLLVIAITAYIVVGTIAGIVSSIFSSCYEYKINEETIGYYYNQEEYDNNISNLIETKENDLNGIRVEYYIAERPYAKKVFVKNSFKNEINNNFDNIMEKYIKVDYTIYEITIDAMVVYVKTEEEANVLKSEITPQIKENIAIETNQKIVQELPEFLTEEKKQEIINTYKKEVIIVEEEKKETKITSRSGGNREQFENTSYQVIKNYKYISQYFVGGYPAHSGVDFAANSGTPIYAWKNGKVTYRGWKGNYGNFIIIKHSDGTISRYAHLNGFNCSNGQEVYGGQTIGYVGSTGKSTGPHLHFEILVNGIFKNPLNYL